MLPSIFSENMFDDFFNDPFDREFLGAHNPLYGKHAKNMMKTDIHEKDDGYELAVELPGFKKDEINVDVSDGYLTIKAAKGLDKDENDKKGELQHGEDGRRFATGNRQAQGKAARTQEEGTRGERQA